METLKQSSKSFFKALQLIYYALIAIQLFLAGITIFINNNPDLRPGVVEFNTIINIVLPLFVLADMLLARYLFQSRLKVCKEYNSLNEKLNMYRAAIILRFAIITGAANFSFIVYLLSGNLLILGLGGFLLLLFLMFKPTPEKAVSDLELTLNDREKLLDPSGIIE
jgi:hypothetical protein